MIAHTSYGTEEASDPTSHAATVMLVKNRQHFTKHRHCPQTQLPLSKNTCKLSQAGTELVDAYESALEYSSSTESLHKSTSNTCSGYFGSDTVTDSEKTPTNFDGKTCFDYCIAQSESQQIDSNRRPFSNVPQMTDAQLVIPATETHSLVELKESDSSDDMYEDCINEAINFMVNVPEALQSKKVASLQKLCKSTELPRIQFQNAEASRSESTPLKNQVDESANISREAASIDGIKFPLPSLLALPEITRLKHRPLSASSISSTTSSSSSGSENLTNKQGVSYLASVESLADQSENELSNTNLTLCERACMEIIDSERCYVDDLGQVIEG